MDYKFFIRATPNCVNFSVKNACIFYGSEHTRNLNHDESLEPKISFVFVNLPNDPISGDNLIENQLTFRNLIFSLLY